GQTVFVRAIGDDAIEGDRTIELRHRLSSTTPEFNEENALIPNLKLTVFDDDKGGLIIDEGDNAQTLVLEGAAPPEAIVDTYDIQLSTQPTEDVTVNLAIGSAGEAPEIELYENGVPITSLGFTANNWNIPRTVEVRAIDDSTRENRELQTIAHSFTSNDPVYQGLQPREVTVRILDNDSPSVVINQSAGRTLVSDTTADTYTLRLASQPKAAVTVNVFSDGQTLVSSESQPVVDAIATVTFTPGNWFTPQTVTVTVDPSVVPAETPTFEKKVAQGPHTVNTLLGSLIIEGGVAEGKDRSLRPPVLLPTESADVAIPPTVLTDETQQADRLNVFNDGSRADDSGVLAKATLDDNLDELIVLSDDALNLSGLGMGGEQTFDLSEAQDNSKLLTIEGGITIDDIEVTEVMLGSGNDTFQVDATSAGTPGAEASVITVIHGGGNSEVSVPNTDETILGGDTITVTGGGGAASPLVIYGDTSQDGSRYNSVISANQADTNGNAVIFNNFGNDVIDASASALSITAYGGPGNDTILGSAEGDRLAGGSGNDTISGNGGNDHIYGDAGFNVDIDVVTEDDIATVSRVLSVPTSNTSNE
ncbi:MAG: hypothetical protein AAFP03_17860, partial [Cyanobacteria bacterium J06598_3]